MTSQDSKVHRLSKLILLSLEGVITEDEAQEINQLLLEDVFLQRFYLAYIDLHASIRNTVDGSCVENFTEPPERSAFREVIQKDLHDSAIRAALSEVTGARGELADTGKGRIHSNRRLPTRIDAIRLLVRVAAVILVAVTAVWLDHKLWQATDKATKAPVELPVLARIQQIQDIVWADPYHPVHVGSDLRLGSYMLEQGWVQFRTNQGASVIVESPAHFTLEIENCIRLHNGLLTANVPDEAVGFTVLTPGTNLIDLGTEFGVQVQSDKTEVQVFDGEVQASFDAGTGRRPLSPRRLHQNDQLVYHQDTGRIVDESVQAVFPRHWNDVLYRTTLKGPFVSINAPTSLKQDEHELGDVIGLLVEKRGVTLNRNMKVTHTQTGALRLEYRSGEEPEAWLLNGLTLDSYLLHVDRLGTKVQLDTNKILLSGSITFTREIAGVICTTPQLVQSDTHFGHDQVHYDTQVTRGLYEKWDADVIRINPDRRTITFSLNTMNYDQLRILVHSP